MIKIKEETFTNDLELIIENENFNCYLDLEHKCIICEAKVSYIPVENFINTFNNITDYIEKHAITKFIFDKRALRAFHQPTMEWYFVEWKKKLMQLGLTQHRKILPQEKWFQKCVEAGRESIMKDNPNFPIHQIDIQYFQSIKECIDN